MLNILKFIHLLSIVIWVGMLVFFSFFVAPSIFRMLPKELAGDLIGDIFPRYWLIGYIAGVSALLSLIIISSMEKAFPAASILLLTVMTAITFYSGLAVASKAREIKMKIRAVNDPVEKEALTKDFRKLHRKSATLNIIVIVTGIVLIFIMARNFRL